MTPSVQSHYGRPDPAEPPIAEIRKVYRPANRNAALELQVKIEGRDRTILLTLDALEGHGLSGPAAVEELRAIRVALERIADALSQGTESHSTGGPG